MPAPSPIDGTGHQILAGCPVTLRPASPSDAPQIAGVHTRSWQVAYRGQLPDAFLDALDPDDRAGSWRRRLTASGAATTLVAVDDRAERIVGFVSLGPGRDEPGHAPSTHGEIHAIYVDPPWWRAGIGSALLTAAADRLRRQGYRLAMLRVLGSNRGTRRFYERHGWQPGGQVGTVRIDRTGPGAVGEDAIEVPELRYTLDLID